MKINNHYPSSCSTCSFFYPEGRVRGNCRQLHVTVDGDWQSCSLGAPAFSSIAELLDQLQLEYPTTKIQEYITADR